MMQEKVWTGIDRKALDWPNGPWDNEPDKVEWRDEATGLPCIVLRNPYQGHLCAYVAVSPGHSLYQVPYEECYFLDVHGGPTFSEMCAPDNGEPEHTRVCHTPLPGESEHVWWFGGDFGHFGDTSPYREKAGYGGPKYWGWDEARDEARSLARQLHVCKDSAPEQGVST